MKRMTCRIVSILVAIMMLVVMQPMATFADSEFTLMASTATAENVAGKSVEIDISISNNPGFASANITVNFDKNKVKLTGIKNQSELMTEPYKYGGQLSFPITSGSYTMQWDGDTAPNNFTENGVLATLVFEILPGAEAGDAIVKISSADITDKDVNSLEPKCVDGKITIEKDAVAASNYTVTLPDNPTYDGTAKSANITPKAGAGAVSKTYYNGSETAPTDAGEYAVTFDVAEGTTYGAATGLSAGTFTIGKADPTITVSESISVVNGSTKALGATIDPADLTLTYESADTSRLTVSADGTLTGVALTTKPVNVEVKFAGNKNYNAASKTVAVSVTDKTPVVVSFNAADSKDYTATGYKLGEQFTAATIAGGKTITGYKYNGANYTDLDALKAVTVTDAGTYTVTAYYETATEYGEKSATFTINKVNQDALTITSGTTVTYGDTLTLTSEGGSGTGAVSYSVVSGDATIDGTTLKASKVGTVKVKASKAGDTNYNSAESAEVDITVSAKEVTITGLSAENKEYDGTTTATVSGTAAIAGKIEGDDLSVQAGTASFADKNAGAAKTVTFTGYSLMGADAANYTLSAQPANATANITKKSVTITGLSAENKEYDGTTTATVSGTAAIAEKIEGDNLSVQAGTASFADKNVGTDKDVTFTGYSLTGADVANYTLTAQPASVTANITKKSVTITGLSAKNKVYDGTTTATVSGTATIEGKFASDDLSVQAGTASFADKNVGTDKDVTFTGYSLTGVDVANYELSAQPASVKASITVADYAGEKAASGEAKYGTSGTVDLSGYIVEGGAATVDSSIEDTDGVLEGTPSIVDKTLQFKFKDDAAIGKTAKIKVNVASGNYKAYTVEVTVTVLDKSAQNIEVSDINASYGDTVKLNPSGTHGAVSYAVTDGTDVISVDESGNVTINKAGDAEITITAAGDDNYAVATKVVKVKIAKRLITVKANDKTMTVNGTLPTFDVTYGNFAAADTKDTVIETEAVAGVAAEVDGKTVGSFDITITTAPILKTGMADKYDFAELQKGVLKVNAASAGGGAIGGGGFIIPTTQKPEVTIDNTQGKLELSADGTTANITANEGYEIEKVTVNGVDKGAVNKLTGLKTGDKVVVSFKSTAPAADDKDAVVKQLTSKISKLQIVARSVKTSKKNVKVTLKTDAQSNAAIKEIKSLGYTVKYKFYRSTKKSKGYKAVLTKTSKTYTNTKGVKGTMYYYKARIQVFDKDGKLVAQTALKQCKYANRQWTK